MEPSDSPDSASQFDDHTADRNSSRLSSSSSSTPPVIQPLSPAASIAALRERATANPRTTETGLPTGSPVPPITPPSQRSRKRILMAVLGAGAIVATIYGYRWWQYTATHQDTDNAYVTGHIHPINARISGTVVRVLVDDNQVFPQGALLVQLDPRDYEVALQQTKASLETW